jgi:hypothetical protein
MADNVPSGLPATRITPSPHSSLGPKFVVFDVVDVADRPPGVDPEPPKPRQAAVHIDPMPR